MLTFGRRVLLGTLLLSCLLLLGTRQPVSALSDPDDFCTGDPCIISSDKDVDPGAVLDFGSRDVILQQQLTIRDLPSGAVGSMTLLAGSFTITGNGQIKGTGGTLSAGSVTIQTVNDIRIDYTRLTGAIRMTGTDGGELNLQSTSGSITGAGKIDLDHYGLVAYGGSLTISAAGNVDLTGSILVSGGLQGGGGLIDVYAAGDVSLTGLVDLTGGEGGGGDLDISAGGSLTLGEVDLSGGGDIGDAGFADLIANTGSVTLLGRFRGRGADTGERCGDGADMDILAEQDITLAAQVDLRGLSLDCMGGFLMLDGAMVRIQDDVLMSGDGSEGAGGDLDIYASAGLSLTGTIKLDGGEGGGGDVLLSAEGDVILEGDIEANGRSSFAPGPAILEIESYGGAIVVEGLINGSGGSGGLGGDVYLDACDVTVGPLSVIDATGTGSTITVVGSDSVLLQGDFIVAPVGAIVVEYGTRADPPDVASATFSTTPTLTLDPLLAPCRLCDSDAECEDFNLCTDDICVPATGCMSVPNSNPCSDGDLCTVGDSCSGGACVGGSTADCDDSNQCTDDSCNSVFGCVSVPNTDPCNDGNACTENDACAGGSCAGTPLVCDDDNPCTDDGCSAGVCEFTPNSDPCADDDACTTADICSAGACIGGPPPDCSDGDVCTTDTCDPVFGCQNEPVAGCVDSDGDGKRDDEDECTTLNWTPNPTIPPNQNPIKFVLDLKKLASPAGEQKILLKGFFNPAPSALPIDPAAKGLHVRLEDEAGGFYDVSIPDGLAGDSPCDDRDGWTAVFSGTTARWKYSNKSGALPPDCIAGSAKGMAMILIKDLRSAAKAALQVKLRAKGATLDRKPAFPINRMRADVTLAAQPAPDTASPEAVAGQCAEALFTGNPIPQRPKPSCKAKTKEGALDHVTCKGL